jgi:hypothetical protein
MGCTRCDGAGSGQGHDLLCIDLYNGQHIFVWCKGVRFHGGTAEVLIEAAIVEKASVLFGFVDLSAYLCRMSSSRARA